MNSDTRGVNPAATWEAVREALREELGEVAYRNWLAPLGFAGAEDGRVTMTAPTRFLRDWVLQQYADLIRATWQREQSTVRAIDIVVDPLAHAAGEAASATETSRAAAPATRRPLNLRPGAEVDGQDASALLDARFTFDNFVVGKSNDLAYAAARRVAEAEQVAFNPLFLYGGVGLGKTHLMHAIGWNIRSLDPSRRVLYLSAEKFMYRFIRALRYRDTMAFKEQFRSVDVLMIDDVQFISGKESTQEEFFHTFNALVDNNRQIVISADRSPSDLDGLEERLRSRLGWGLVADLHATTYELRLVSSNPRQPRSRASIFPRWCSSFWPTRSRRTCASWKERSTVSSPTPRWSGRAVTLEMTQEVLHDLLRANDRRVTIEEIQKRVAEHYNIKLLEMSSHRRARVVARPRQVAMYLSKQLTQRSLPEIGRKFGGRDHTTVMHAVRRIEQLRETNAEIAEDVELLLRMLET